MSHVQLFNLTKMLPFNYEMGSTCNKYGVEEQCVQGFDVET
jgi:hypothetical protein